MNRKMWIGKTISIILILVAIHLFNQQAAEFNKIKESNREIEEANFSASKETLKSGVYEGQAQGFGGKILVSVTIDKGHINNVEVISANGEDEPYYTMARKVADDIVENNSVDVDNVSGATYSANGIKLAVEDAIKQAE